MTTTEIHTDDQQESTDNHQQRRTPGVTPSAAVCVDETPTPDVWETPLRPTAPAARLGIGRFTVDLVAHGDHVLAAAGRGVGSPPTVGLLPIGATAVLVELADTVDARTVWGTQVWPLAADTATRPGAEG